ncbi:MAG: DUF4097 domain-containing protein [Candidatus Eremiobacteraeota bacterium]|nr:DUF4097 domain-containing protein [Candidatus Eremiobacteraeota bacterium]
MSTRAKIIGTLFAVEVALFGAIVYFLGGAPTHAASVNIGGDRIVAAIDAGSAPHVVVSDPDSRVVLSVSNDGRVRVTDRSLLHGWMLGGPHEIPPVRVTRTEDGVRIERAAYAQHRFMMFGSSTERVEIELPAQASVDVVKSSGSNASGLQGTLAIRSQDGRIEMHDMTTASITAHSDDGRIILDGALQPNGHYILSTADGRIRVQYRNAAGLAIHAHTQDGSIRIDGRRITNDDSAPTYDAAGTADGKLDAQTQNGSITINTTGVR